MPSLLSMARDWRDLPKVSQRHLWAVCVSHTPFLHRVLSRVSRRMPKFSQTQDDTHLSVCSQAVLHTVQQGTVNTSYVPALSLSLFRWCRRQETSSSPSPTGTTVVSTMGSTVQSPPTLPPRDGLTMARRPPTAGAGVTWSG